MENDDNIKFKVKTQTNRDSGRKNRGGGLPQESHASFAILRVAEIFEIFDFSVKTVRFLRKNEANLRFSRETSQNFLKNLIERKNLRLKIWDRNNPCFFSKIEILNRNFPCVLIHKLKRRLEYDIDLIRLLN